MTWLDIKHFLTNSRRINGRSEKNPPEKSFSIPRIITGTTLFSYFQGSHNITLLSRVT